ncbi:MAG: PEP-CTERM/exosortase system-associated acyltransferase [Nitrosomonas sp.]|nr:MAG: PEP-CTERM/exosortase system-associated acyltransferase [Nitrosomonas sp.]
MGDLYLNFQKYFEIVMADTDELLEHVYKLRYQVLCVEKRLPGFESEHCPDQMEQDDYDRHSSHVLLKYKPTGEYIGTARLILPDPLELEKQFPIELYTQVDPDICNVSKLSRLQTAEISRFLVVKKFDRRKNDRRAENRRQLNLVIDNDKREREDRRVLDRRSAISIALVLTTGIIRLSVTHKIVNLLSIMDPALNRLLGFYGLNFKPIGPVIDYHGARRPYYINLEEVLLKLHQEYHDFWEIVTDKGLYSLSECEHQVNFRYQ